MPELYLKIEGKTSYGDKRNIEFSFYRPSDGPVEIEFELGHGDVDVIQIDREDLIAVLELLKN